jgi:hypothetical protein
MGLLDDAIRDHLELKRRRGADPAEVEQAEREALGPVRRQPEGDEELDYADEPMLPGEAGDAQPGSLDYDDEPGAYEDDADPDPASVRELERFEPRDPGVDTKPHEAVRPDNAEPTPPPYDEAAERPAPPPRRVGDETAEYDVEAEHPDEREDVLEETPEFLQDTPDHDRLWFEQRPPRDFDFDG